MVKRLSELVSEMETNSLTACADMVNYVLKNTLTGTERQPQALFMWELESLHSNNTDSIEGCFIMCDCGPHPE